MRFVILHCRNTVCGEHVWVPEHRLGTRGRCPHCGEMMETPDEVPADALVEGPPIMKDFTEGGRTTSAAALPPDRVQ